MWHILEKKTLAKKLKNVPKPILMRYELWKRIVEIDGPSGLQRIKGFYDEALKGSWKGFRSSRLNIQWRVIYQVQDNECRVYVIDMNAHNYKRK